MNKNAQKPWESNTHTHINNFKVKIVNFFKSIDKHYLYLFLIIFFIFLPYVSNGFIKGHDFNYHINNLLAMDRSISLTNFKFFASPIRDVLANNLGYGEGLFYPQLTYYLTIYIFKFLKLFDLSIVQAVKVVEFLICLLSGIIMYKFMNITFKNKDVAFASSIMYISAPYFLSDVFVRMSYSEIGIFLFMPIVMCGITYLLQKDYKKFVIYFVIGYSGMILSHLVLTLFFTGLLAIVLLINIKGLLNKKSILNFLLACVLVICITLPFTLPVFQNRMNTGYMVFEDGVMANAENLNNRRLAFTDFITNTGSTSVWVCINIIVIIFAVLATINIRKIIPDKSKRWFVYSLYVFLFLSIIISSKLINWEDIPSLFYLIQFPWRMCAFIVLGISIIAGLGILTLKPDNIKIALIIICAFCLFYAADLIQQKDIKIQSILYTAEEYQNFSYIGGQHEYLPVKAQNNLDYLKERSQDVLNVNETDAVITITQNSTPYLQFECKLLNDGDNVTLELPRLYYLGYKITLEKLDGTSETLEYYENDNGLIELNVNETGIITVDYVGTKLSKVADVICIVSIVFLIVYMVKRKRKTN